MRSDTPGNPFAEPLPDGPTGRPSQAIGTIGDLLVYEVRRGGMGEVYLCGSADSTGPALAFKTFQQRFFLNRDVRQAFVREAAVWSRLSGEPHILPAFGVVEMDGRPFVNMQLVPPSDYGTTVRDVLRTGPLSAKAVLSVAMQTAMGMALAHRRVPGLVHGDLKPENLLLLGDWVFISDFGLATVITDEMATELASTWAYRAPECWDAPPTPAADVYAYGTVLYELLTGHPPYAAAGSEEWLAAQRSGAIAVPNLDDALGRGLLSVAFRCLDVEANQRPADFEAILGLLHEHSPAPTFSILQRSAHLAHMWRELQPFFIEQRVRSLTKLGEHELALDEIDRLTPDDLTPVLLRLHGSLLSMTGRDTEALAKFEAALEAGLPTDDSIGCRSEYALSLNRLGRYREAADLLSELIVTAKPQQRAELVVNLATVYLADGQPDKALGQLVRTVREHPGVWQLWANKGKAHEALGEYDEAVTAYQQALGIAPHEPQLQLMLAAVCMDHLDDLGTAFTALTAAHDQGLSSAQWFVRYQACNLRLGRDKEFEALNASVRRQVGDEQMDELLGMVKDLTHRRAAPPPPPKKSAPPKESAPPKKSAPPKESATMDKPAPEGKPASDRQPSGTSEKLLPSTPFLNMRLYLPTNYFSIDFFYSVRSPYYVEAFEQSYTESVNRMRLNIPEVEMRSTPLYFACCPGCGGYVLTNRDIGKHLRCRWCEVSAPTEAYHDDHLDWLSAAVHERLGKRLTDFTDHVHVLLVSATSSDHIDQIRSLGSEFGFTDLPLDNAAVMRLLSEAESRGLVSPARRFVVALRKISDPGSTGYADGTPPVVESLIIMLRKNLGNVGSASMTYSPSDDDYMVLSYEGRHDELIGRLRQELADHPFDEVSMLVLSQVVLAHGSSDEAQELISQGVRLWPDQAKWWLLLGYLRFRSDRFAEAAEAFERSLGIDPIQSRALLMLARCHRELGNARRAEMLEARARSLGRPW
jgi:serine/threonine protein kinase